MVLDQHSEASDDSSSVVINSLTVRTARWMAITGCVMLLLVSALIVVSTIGRKLFAMPIPGDVELTSMVAAVATAWFLPWCHVASGNVKVDFFTNGWNPRVVACLEAAGSLLLAVIAILFAWRTSVAAVSVKDAGEISAILGIQAWYAYAGMVPGFIALAAVSLRRVFECLRAPDTRSTREAQYEMPLGETV